MEEVFEIIIKSEFAAAHYMKNYSGKCSKLHGHNWTVEVKIEDKLNDEGMVLDFDIAKQALAAVLEELDHSLLNEVSEFGDVNPTTENIAKYIYNKLMTKTQIGQKQKKVKEVKVYETGATAAVYKRT